MWRQSAIAPATSSHVGLESYRRASADDDYKRVSSRVSIPSWRATAREHIPWLTESRERASDDVNGAARYGSPAPTSSADRTMSAESRQEQDVESNGSFFAKFLRVCGESIAQGLQIEYPASSPQKAQRPNCVQTTLQEFTRRARPVANRPAR